MPWNSLEGTLSEHEELRWQDGPGPTYSKHTANELLHYRYRTVPQSLRITLTRLLTTQQFPLVVAQLRSEGWLDWHILTAVMNITLNYRLAASGPMPPSAERMEQALQRLSEAEGATDAPVPLAAFSYERMKETRRVAMLSVARNWDLECYQETPDMPGIEKFLAARYGYWDDDVPHVDPFFQSDASSGSLIISS